MNKPIEYRQLGRSGVRVSPLCLGTMMFGGATSEADALGIIAKAKDGGVNFIDTADVYTDGESERITGRAIRQDRDWWVLATKFCNVSQPGPNGYGLSRRYAFIAAEASLKRLGVETIDILYLHKEDHTTPLEEVVQAIADLIRAGKIRYFGVSNHRAWRVAEICRLCDLAGIGRPLISQPYYNAMNRMPEVEHLPACGHFGLAVFPYSPLARGVLTGKYLPDASPDPASRAGRQDKRMLESEWRHESLVIAQTLAAHARARGITPGQFAMGWVLNNKLVTGAIAGPRTMAQWDEYRAALDYTFTSEDEALVDSLVTAGHPSTPGYNDPAYPLEGRISRAATR